MNTIVFVYLILTYILSGRTRKLSTLWDWKLCLKPFLEGRDFNLIFATYCIKKEKSGRLSLSLHFLCFGLSQQKILAKEKIPRHQKKL